MFNPVPRSRFTPATSAHDRSIPNSAGIQTRRPRDTSVTLRLGAFISSAVLPIVLVCGHPRAVPAAPAAGGAQAALDGSHLSYRSCLQVDAP
jgi:hypothetical protein